MKLLNLIRFFLGNTYGYIRKLSERAAADTRQRNGLRSARLRNSHSVRYVLGVSRR